MEKIYIIFILPFVTLLSICKTFNSVTAFKLVSLNLSQSKRFVIQNRFHLQLMKTLG